LRNVVVLLSITHRQATSPDFQRAFYDAVAAYADSKDTAAFHFALRDIGGQVQAFGQGSASRSSCRRRRPNAH
jgi:hypothetical protein